MFTYCPKCKGIFKQDNYRFDCSDCGFVYFLNPSPTNGAFILNHNNEVLLAKRAIEPSKGLWDTPGGFIDPNENAEQGLTREIKEELGITITDWHYVGSYEGTYDWGGVIRPILGFVYYTYTDVPIDHMKALDDISEIQFFPLDDLPTDHFSFEPMHQMTQDLQTALQKNRP